MTSVQRVAEIRDVCTIERLSDIRIMIKVVLFDFRLLSFQSLLNF